MTMERRRAQGLSDAVLRRIKRVDPTRDRARKHYDTGGLYLLETVAGGRLWRLKYRWRGKEKKLSLGSFPEVSLAKARVARDRARLYLRDGRDPGLLRHYARMAALERSAQTFEAVAREWFAVKKSGWAAEHADKVIGTLESHVFPPLGALPIADIGAWDVLKVLRAIEERPAVATARKVRQRMSAVFVYAMATGRGGASDPAATVRPALAPMVVRPQPALTSLPAIRMALEAAEAVAGHPIPRLALRLLALTAVRPGVINSLPWRELDSSRQDDIWAVPAERMKTRRPFLVPLSHQALETIAAAHMLTGDRHFVFPSQRRPQDPLSAGAIRFLLNRAGYSGKHVPHGWRAAFSTVMNERFPADRLIIDLMLAHVSKDRVEAAYNRGAYLDRRRELAQEWADLLLDGFCSPLELVDQPPKGARLWVASAI